MESKQKVLLVLIVVAALLGVSVIVYFGFIRDDDDNDTPPNGNGDDDVGDDDDVIPPRDRPKAVIIAPTEAYQYYDVTFDAGSSTDPDGQPLIYAWYFDDDDAHDAETAVATWSFDEIGIFYVDLVVENPDGQTDTETHKIEIVVGTGNPEFENITLDEGNDGTIYRKAMGSSDVLKHWTMPADVKMVEATLYWTEPDWELRFSMGKGDSPDTGTQYVDDSADEGPLTITYSATSDNTLATGQWYLRIGILNEDQHQPVVEQCEYDIGLKIYYLTPDDL